MTLSNVIFVKGTITMAPAPESGLPTADFTLSRPTEYIFGEPLLPHTQVDLVDAAHELIAMQLDIPSISATALQQWSEAVITASLMARMTGTGDDEMGAICDHLQHLINNRRPDGSLLLTDADRERIADAVDTMTAVASVTPDRIARMCAEACEAAMQSGRLPDIPKTLGR